jgi:hypothetical protein
MTKGELRPSITDLDVYQTILTINNLNDHNDHNHLNHLTLLVPYDRKGK